ncbi:hypothetical protein [Leifsonia xyli]|uniref:hypothetical protein n=1 Tax=Leifsonia xyli TaxID=1575 RepID=UPI003D67683C
MTEYSSLRELEDAQDQAVVNARRRLERAEEGVAYYRSQMARMQEDFHALAVREGAADDPGFRAALHRVSDITEAEVWEANRAVARLRGRPRRAEDAAVHRTRALPRATARREVAEGPIPPDPSAD